VSSYTPIYKRLPNKFIRYEERAFDDGAGHKAILNIAIFSDKKNTIQEMVAHVNWNIS